jgi:hypothetical protein
MHNAYNPTQFTAAAAAAAVSQLGAADVYY